MTDHMRQVRTGERLRIKAATMNEILMATARSRANLYRSGSGRIANANDPGMVILQNSSDQDVDFGHVLGIASTPGVVLPSGMTGDHENDRVINLERRVIIGVKPTSDHVGRWAIVLEGQPRDDAGTPSAILPVNSAGIGLVSGIWPVLLNVIDEGHRYAEVNPDAADPTLLESASSGSAQVLWKEDGTGERWAVVRFPFSSGTVSAGAEYVTFGSPYLLDQVTGTASASGHIENEFYTANSEQRLLFKATETFGSGNPVRIVQALGGWPTTGYLLSMSVDNDKAVEFSATFSIYPIIEDYDPAALTWANQPAVGTLIDTFELRGKLQFRNLPAVPLDNELNANVRLGTIHGNKTTGCNGQTCYGLEIRSSGWFITGSISNPLMLMRGDFYGVYCLKWGPGDV